MQALQAKFNLLDMLLKIAVNSHADKLKNNTNGSINHLCWINDPSRH